MKHEWELERGSAGGQHPLFIVATGKGRGRLWDDESTRLAGAAPKMLEALKAARCFIGDELEARQGSYLPTDEEGDLEYIGQAERAFEAVCAAIAKTEER
jgi:hypothetical protein